MNFSQRAEPQDREIQHGILLKERGPVDAWGWGTPAGILRARRRAALIERKAALAEGRRVLELGCGTGMFSEMWSRLGIRRTAVDISPELIREAKRRDLAGHRVEFIAEDFAALEVDEPFDAIIGSSFLHHLDLARALPKVFRLLRPGGRLCFAEPNLLNPQVFLERTFRTWKCFWYVSPDETAFVRWSLSAELRRTGFQEVEIEPFDWLHPGLPVGAIPLVKRIGRCLERTAVAREFAGSLIISAHKPK